MFPGRSPRLALAALLLGAAPLGAQDLPKRIDRVVDRYAELGRFNGAVLVANRGKVIYQKGVGLADAEWNIPNQPDTRFRIGSVTKQFTAMLILLLADEGRLSLDGTVGDYLPEYPAGPGRAVTIHQLLTHTSGIPSYTGLPDYFPSLSRHPARPLDFLARFDSLPLEFAPGSQWRYDNSGYFLLGVIIERLTRLSYAAALQRRILEPLGLRDTGYDSNAVVLPRRATGYARGFDGDQHAPFIDMSTPYAAGALYSTVRDLYRWDQALDARRLLSPRGYEAWFAPRVPAVFGHYAYGWFVHRVSRGPGRDSALAIQHGGSINGFGAMNFRVPEDGIAIIYLDNTGQHPPLERDILRILYGEEPDPPVASIARTIYPVILKDGMAPAVSRYRALKSGQPHQYDFGEQELNLLGYHLLATSRVSEATAIFRLNTECYPESGNAFDSLGEAELAAGDTAAAVASYRRSLALDAGNANAAALLERLGAR